MEARVMTCPNHITSITRVCFALQAVGSAGEDDALSAGTQAPTARVGCDGGSSPQDDDQYCTTSTSHDSITEGRACYGAVVVVDRRGTWASAEAGLAGDNRGADPRRTYRDRLEYDREVARAARCTLCAAAAAPTAAQPFSPRPYSFVRGQASEPLAGSDLLSAGENSAPSDVIDAHLETQQCPGN